MQDPKLRYRVWCNSCSALVSWQRLAAPAYACAMFHESEHVDHDVQVEHYRPQKPDGVLVRIFTSQGDMRGEQVLP